MTMRWVNGVQEEREVPRADAFLADLIAVCRKHGLCLSHEDQHGSFIVAPLDELYIEWLNNASVEPEVLT